MTGKEMFGKAKWFSPSSDYSQPIFADTFEAPDFDMAELIICGLGFFKAYINGRSVSSDLFVPAWTDYNHVDRYINGELYKDRFRHSINVLKYDVSLHIKPQNNIIAVLVGPGWYVKYNFGKVKLCFKIDFYKDGKLQGSFYSNDTVKWTKSHITESQIIRHEIQDFNVAPEGFIENLTPDSLSDDRWQKAVEIEAPESDYVFQTTPADKVIRTLSPKLVRDFGDIKVYDVGQNISGRVKIDISGLKAGESALIVYSELINEDGEIDFATHSWGKPQANEFISDGKAKIAAAEFSWFGFRYFSLTSNAKPIVCDVIHADVPVTSCFMSSSYALNWLYDAFINTQLTNMHAGIPSDCPHREGRGYTGDGQLVSGCGLLLFDSKEFYKKWLRDIADCQDETTGHVQYTAPFVQSGGGPGGWGGAIAIVPYNYYLRFGDLSVLKEFFPRMLKYFKYLDDHSENDLVVSDEPWAWCLGDWCTPDEIKIPAPFVNNYFYVKTLEIAIKTAKLIGKEEYIPELSEKLNIKKAATVKHYFNESTGDFADNIQGANAFAVDIGLGDERTFQRMAENYKKLGMYDTGIFGTDIVTRVLFERGQGQLAFDLLTSEKEISFSTQMKKGATTIWEYWTHKKSNNHPMFGAVVKYLFDYLLGIRQKAETAGCKDIIISPVFVNGLDFVSGYITLDTGKLEVTISKNEKKADVTVFVPDGIKATLLDGDKALVLKAETNKYQYKL